MSGRLIPFGAIIGALLIFFLYINPTYAGPVAQLRAEIATNAQVHAAANEYLDHVSVLAKAKNQLNAAGLARLETLLPDAVNNVQVMLDLNTLAGRSGLALNGINVSSAAAEESATGRNPLGSVDITLSLVGSYDAFRTFLTSVERSLRLLDVKALSISAATAASHVYTYDLSVRLYWLR